MLFCDAVAFYEIFRECLCCLHLSVLSRPVRCVSFYPPCLVLFVLLRFVSSCPSCVALSVCILFCPNALVDVPPCKRQNWKLRTLPPMRCDVRPKHDPHYRVPPCSLQRRSNVTQCHQSGAAAVLQEDTRGFSHLHRAGGKGNMIARSAHGAWNLNPAQLSMHPWAGFWISR